MNTKSKLLILTLIFSLMIIGAGCTNSTTGGTTAEPTSTPSAGLEEVFPNLTFSKPVHMLQAPGDSTKWYLAEKDGMIYYFSSDNSTDVKSTFIDLTNVVDSGSGEGGLLGIAFHPDFQNNGYVYLSFTRTGAPLTSYISRYTLSNDGMTLDPNSEEVILTLDQPYTNHNGGHILFGPDGYLYAGFGDGGSSGDPAGNAQNTANIFGSIIRIDVDGGSPYAIPSDNPFANGGGKPEIFAYGLRNPWKFSFDSQTGTLWAADVGQGAWEELDKIESGKNYGWNIKEGDHCYNADSCDETGLTDPVFEYSHDDGHSITGGYVYRGSEYPNLQGLYFFGDFEYGKVWFLSGLYTESPEWTEVADTDELYSTFAQANNGELYVLGYLSGKIFHIVKK